MTIHPMIAVRDVPASADFYGRLLGAVSGHGGDVVEQRAAIRRGGWRWS